MKTITKKLSYIFLVATTLTLIFSGMVGADPDKHFSSLLSPEQLKIFIDNGYKVGNYQRSEDRGLRGNKVVILNVSPGRIAYDAGHIPGAHFVSIMTDLHQTRTDGPIMVNLMVADGPQMDAHIQKYGIDDKTTVVFTTNNILWAVRAYWTYRYWGFPQDHLFVLDGKGTTADSVWTAAGYTLETEEPPLPSPSNFSVSSWPSNVDEVRASLEEFLDVAAGNVPDSIVIDVRGPNEWNALPPATRAFEFRVKNSIWREWNTQELVGDGSHKLRPIADIQAELEAAGATRDKTAYPF